MGISSKEDNIIYNLRATDNFKDISVGDTVYYTNLTGTEDIGICSKQGVWSIEVLWVKTGNRTWLFSRDLAKTSYQKKMKDKKIKVKKIKDLEVGDIFDYDNYNITKRYVVKDIVSDGNFIACPITNSSINTYFYSTDIPKLKNVKRNLDKEFDISKNLEEQFFDIEEGYWEFVVETLNREDMINLLYNTRKTETFPNHNLIFTELKTRNPHTLIVFPDRGTGNNPVPMSTLIDTSMSAIFHKNVYKALNGDFIPYTKEIGKTLQDCQYLIDSGFLLYAREFVRMVSNVKIEIDYEEILFNLIKHLTSNNKKLTIVLYADSTTEYTKLYYLLEENPDIKSLVNIELEDFETRSVSGNWIYAENGIYNNIPY